MSGREYPCLTVRLARIGTIGPVAGELMALGLDEPLSLTGGLADLGGH